MPMKLTEEEKDDLKALTADELRVVVEEAVRKRKKVKEDKSAYAKACNDLIKMQEARMDFAVDELERRAQPAAAPSPSPVPPPPPAH